MSIPAYTSTPEVEVHDLSAVEWQAAAEKALKRLGLTYDELAEQARRRDFVSIEARKVWVAIGGSRP